MYDPSNIGKEAGGVWLAILQGIFSQIPGVSEILQWIKDETGIDLTKVLAGFDLSNPGGILPQIISAAGGSGNTLGDLESALGALAGGVETLWTEFQTALGAASPGDAASKVEAAASNAITALTNLIEPSRIPVIPVAHVKNTNPNLLINGGFDGSISMDGEGLWFWDGTVGVSGTTPVGSARVDCDGTDHLLTSNFIDTVAGDTFSFTVYFSWSGVTNSGASTSSVGFQVQAYDSSGNPVGGPSNLGSAASVTGTSAFFPASNTYTTPSGATKVALQLIVGAASTGGHIWFDNCDAHKTGILPTNLVLGPTGTNDLGSDLAALVSGTGNTSWTTLVSDLLGTKGAAALANTNLGLLLTRLFGVGGTSILPAILPDITKNLSSDLQKVYDATVTQFTGQTSNPATNTTLPQLNTALSTVFNNLVQAQAAIQALQTTATGRQTTGTASNVNFSTYPAGALPNPPFTYQHYTGGSSRAVINSSGNASWSLVADSAVTGIFGHNAISLTDYQLISATVASGPAQGNGASNWMFARANSTFDTMVYFRAYCDGFLSYKGELGCFVGGTQHVWLTGFTMPLNTNNQLQCGDPTSPYKFTVLSNGNPVTGGTYIDSAHQSQIGTAQRYWGFGGTVGVSGSNTYAPGDGVLVSMVDHSPPAVTGFNFRAHRASTSGAALTSGAVIPSGVFDTVDRISNDMTWDGQAVTVSKAGTYMVSIRMQVGVFVDGTGGYATAYKTPAATGVRAIYGVGGWSACSINAGFGINVTQNDAVQYTLLVYCDIGDKITPGLQGASGKSCTGESTGSLSYFEVGLLNPDNG